MNLKFKFLRRFLRHHRRQSQPEPEFHGNRVFFDAWEMIRDSQFPAPTHSLIPTAKEIRERYDRLVSRSFSANDYRRNCMSYCEWNPDKNEPAKFWPARNKHEGCQNQATISVGAKGQWHLCESCAALPEFRRFRARKEIK